MVENQKSIRPKFGHCPVCSKSFQKNPRGTNKFCSKACKQKAYRAKQTTPMERAINAKDTYAKRTATKIAHKTEYNCAECGKSQIKNGLEANRIYCSDACKVKAYRKRKAADQRDQELRVERLHIRGFPGLQLYFYKVIRDFKVTYGYDMIIAGSKLEQGPDGYYARKGDDLNLWFSSIGVCVTWLQDYYANKQPNMAMLRKR